MNMKGFSLLEMLVSVSLLGIVTATFTNSTMMMTQMLHSADLKSKGILAAQQVLDETRLVLPSTMPSTLTSDAAVNVVVNGTIFSVVQTYCSVSKYCPPTSSTETRHIKVTVSYNNTQVYEVQTVFTEFE